MSASATAQPALTLPTPPGVLPLEEPSTAVSEYRAGRRPPEALLACIDHHGPYLEGAIQRRIDVQAADFALTVRQLELLHYQLAASQAQARWLRSFPHGRSTEAAPVMCRLPSGHLVAVPAVLAALGELVVDPQPAKPGARELVALTPSRNGNGR